MTSKKVMLKTVCDERDKPYLGYIIEGANVFFHQVRPYLIGKKLEKIFICCFYALDDCQAGENYFDYEARHPVLELYDGHSYYHHANWEGPLILKFDGIQLEARMWSSDCYELSVNTIKIKKTYNADAVGLDVLASLKGMRDGSFIDISSVLGQLIGKTVVDVKLIPCINSEVGTALGSIVFYLDNGKSFSVFNHDDFIDIDAAE